MAVLLRYVRFPLVYTGPARDFLYPTVRSSCSTAGVLCCAHAPGMLALELATLNLSRLFGFPVSSYVTT